MKNKFISKKMIKGIVTAGLLALMCILTSSGKGVEAQEITADVWQDITVSASKTFILSENDNSMWIPVNVSKKGVVNLECTLTEKDTSVLLGVFDKKDMTSERKFTRISNNTFISQETGRGDLLYPVTTTGVRYIYIEKDVDDRGKKITVGITPVFYEESVPKVIEKDKEYTVIQSDSHNDLKFILTKPRKVIFNIENNSADILDYKKDVCFEMEYSNSVYLDKGTYYLRVWGVGKQTISFSEKNVSIKDANNVIKDKAQKIDLTNTDDLEKSVYLNYKKNKNRELWYKIKSSVDREVIFTCSYDSQSTVDYVRSITTYDSKGKKNKTDGNIITLKKGINYVKVKLIKEAVSGILKTTVTKGIYFNNDTEVSEMVPVENSASVYAKDVINSTYAVKSYSDYTKLLKKVENKFSADNKGFNIECDEFYAALKRYDKSFFKKNNLIFYTYTATDSGKNARGAYITKENINGVNTLVCSFVGLPYYGGGFDSVEHYCYVVQISKKDTAKAEKFTSRHVAMRCR